MYTYIIESQGLYKIGKTKNVKSRLEAYRTHNPLFKLVKEIEGDYEDIIQLHYINKRHHLEWYSLSEEDIHKIDSIVSKYNISNNNDNRSRRVNKNPGDGLMEINPCSYLVQSAKNRGKTMSLSTTAMRMLVYIMYEIKPEDNGHITITPEQYNTPASKGSVSSYHRAIEELVTEGYITTTLQKYVYWVNPILLFAGNRVRKYMDKVTIENTHTW